ncbi:MAG TPA: hypothetical protein VN181_15075, partial [Thermoanaerobaculia bacterium]|nr:hypothetical protein [Thermoanaerobaculia bacterium]
MFALLSHAAYGQPVHFGTAFPLTDTRYATSRGHLPLLLSNGREPVLFWSDDQSVRAARVVDGQLNIGRAVAKLDRAEAEFDAVWTGTHFLVVSTSNTIVGRIVSATGEAIGEPFSIVAGRLPRIAFNGRNVLMLFAGAGTIETNALLLTTEGQLAEPAPRALGITQNGRAALASNGTSFAAVIPRDIEPRVVTFDDAGRVSADAMFGPYGSAAAIASDGRRYLAVAACGINGGLCGPMYARTVESDGTLGAQLDLDEPFPHFPAAAWTGSGWTIAYERNGLRVAHLDAAAKRIERREEGAGSESSLAMIGGRLMRASVSGQQSRGPIFVDGVPATFTATRQMLIATATSSDATLIVWQEIGGERTTLHTGLRTRDGRWSERTILTVPVRDCCYEEMFSGLAASDGREFLLV